ncbi:MAG: hypothetical protein WBD20_17165 [Pirellulaceae bacterium]
MNQVVDKLDRLGQQLNERPSLADGVMAEIETREANAPRLHRPVLRTVLAFASAACVLIAVGSWLLQPTSLYAQTVAALAKANTIHVTGWASDVMRKWPLENPTGDTAEKYPIEGWYWNDDDTPMSYEKIGPVIQFRSGSKLQEYQKDVDLLFVTESNPKDSVERLSALANYLQLLKAEGANTTDLGTRTENGKSQYGIKIVRGGPAEFWFDAETNLPVHHTRTKTNLDGEEVQFELRFAYDKQVPRQVSSFEPPATKHVRSGSGTDRKLVWDRHVQKVGVRLKETPPASPIAILPRESSRVFSFQYIRQTPDGKYWVLPLGHDQYFQLTVKNFVNLRVQHGGKDRGPETWRVPAELLDLEFPRVDLIYKDGTPWQEWVQFALNHIGLEYVDVEEERTYWVAEHDGRDLKPWQDVHPPVPYLVRDGKVQRGVVRPGIGHQQSPETMHGLFQDFNRIQNSRYTADHPIIIDQTGLPRPPKMDREKYKSWEEFKEAVNYDQFYVASDSPYFPDEPSRKMARDWFEKEFGVTMKVEKRPMTIHVIRRKQ